MDVRHIELHKEAVMTIIEVTNKHSKGRVFRVDFKDERYYFEFQGTEHRINASVTTILGRSMPTSPYLIKWMLENGKTEAERIRDDRANYGTLMHKLCADYLQKGIDLSYDNIVSEIIQFGDVELYEAESLQKDVLAFAQFANDCSLEMIESEITLTSQFGYAGTLDIVANISKNKQKSRVLIDLKSGKKGFWDSHIVQLRAYADMWNENFPAMPVERFCNWSPQDWRAKPTYNFEDQTDKDVATILPNILATDKVMFKPRTSMIIVDGTIKPGIDISNNFKTVDIADYIREKYNLEQPQTQFLKSKQIKASDFLDF